MWKEEIFLPAQWSSNTPEGYIRTSKDFPKERPMAVRPWWERERHFCETEHNDACLEQRMPGSKWNEEWILGQNQEAWMYRLQSLIFVLMNLSRKWGNQSFRRATQVSMDIGKIRNMVQAWKMNGQEIETSPSNGRVGGCTLPGVGMGGVGTVQRRNQHSLDTWWDVG